jgi:hypothetical protein
VPISFSPQIKESDVFYCEVNKGQTPFTPFFGFPLRQLSERDQSHTTGFGLYTRKQMKKRGGFFCPGVRDTSKTGRFNDHSLSALLGRRGISGQFIVGVKLALCWSVGPCSFEVTISWLKLSNNTAVLYTKGAVRVMYS